jgi:3-oxoadipate enol-lactonase
MPYVRTRLGRWFYEERGAAARPGDPAIVLWPSLLFDGGMWRHQIEPLSALGRVLVFDGPGHGKSEVPRPFTLEENADALIDAFGELKVDHAVMAGLSWGGMLGMRAALQHPSRFKALALLDTSAGPETKPNAIKYRAFLEYGRRLGIPPLLSKLQIVPLMFSEATIASKPELVERFTRAANGFPREGVAQASLAVVVNRSDVLSKIGRLQVPTLVVCGREDRSTPLECSRQIARTIPKAHLVVIEGAGHVSALEKPAEVNAALVPFVREQFT